LSSKEINFYPATHVYGPVRGWLTSLSNHVTKNDDEPTSFTPVGNEADRVSLMAKAPGTPLGISAGPSTAQASDGNVVCSMTHESLVVLRPHPYLMFQPRRGRV
jgi:hypothetical protein